MQLGTYLIWDPGADYGAKGLIQSIESSNALRDGGLFGYRNVGPRRMAFPLLLRDVPGQTLLQTESLLREWTTSGAAVAVQPETVPSGQAVFFDVLDGRWEPDYDGFHNRAGRRKGTLYLDTQPWGYWPTEMLLASAASIGFLGQLAVNGASVLGDVPPLAHVALTPTCPSGYVTAGYPWLSDMVALSFGGRPSFTPFMPPASFTAATLSAVGLNVTPTLVGDAFAPASQALRFTIASQGGAFIGGGWLNLALGAIPSVIEPAYRGRFRVFSFVKIVPSWTALTLVDAARGPSAMYGALATGNQLATAPAVEEGNTASPGYFTLDMGELTLPPAGSGIQMAESLRLWSFAAAPPVGSAQIWFGGLWLLPVDGAAGILTRGMAIPSIGGAYQGAAAGYVNPTQGGVEFNGNMVESVLLTASYPASAPIPAAAVGDGRAYYRGVPLRVSASTTNLFFLTADRTRNATGGLAQANVEFSRVSVSYRPSFQFLAGL